MGSETRPPSQPGAIAERLIDAMIKSLAKTLPPETSVPHLRAHIGQQLEQLFKTYPTPDHPPYALMIRQAIEELNEDGGSDEEAISKMIKLKYQSLPWGHRSLLSHHLKKLSNEKEIICLSGDRYMLPPEECDGISTVKQQQKRKRKSLHKEKSAKQRKLSNNDLLRSPEKWAQGNEANEEQIFKEQNHEKMEGADQAFEENSLEVKGERKEGQQVEEAVEDPKEGNYQHCELDAETHSREEQNDADNIQAQEPEELDYLLAQEDQAERQEICRDTEKQNQEDEDLEDIMVGKKTEKIETEIQGIEKLIESQRQQEEVIINEVRQQQNQADAGREIADNRPWEGGSVLTSSLILSRACQGSRDFGTSISSKDKCLELLKRTKAIRKCLYEILESIDTQERSANAKEATVLGDVPVIPDVSIQLRQLQEQQQEPTLIKEGKQANFKIGERLQEIPLQGTEAQGQKNQKRLLARGQQFEAEANAMPASIAESLPLIYCKQTEQQENLLNQGQHNSGANIMHPSTAVFLPEHWRSNILYPSPTEAATSTLFSAMQRKAETTQQAQLLSETHKPSPSSVELTSQHQQPSEFLMIDSPLMKPPVLGGEKLKPLEPAELKKLINGKESRCYKTMLSSQAIASPPKLGPSLKRRVTGRSQCEHREEKQSGRRGRPPKLKHKTGEELSVSQKRLGRPPKPKAGAGEVSPLCQKRRGRPPNPKPDISLSQKQLPWRPPEQKPDLDAAVEEPILLFQ